MKKNYNKYFFYYIGVVFIVSWTLLISCTVFSKYFTPYIGKLTLTHPLVIFILYLPSLTGLMIYYSIGGFKALARIFLKLIPRKQDLFWFLIIFVIFIVFFLFLHYGCIFMGYAVPKMTYTFAQIIEKALWNFIAETGLLGGIFGWVAFLLPFLQRKFQNNIPSALLTGFIFGLWVLPGYGISLTQTTTSYLLYVLQLMSFMLFASYIFNATKGNLSFYLFAFWLAATGSHIQLYYFSIPVQILEIVFFVLAAIILHPIFKDRHVKYSLQVFPDFIDEDLNGKFLNVLSKQHA